MRTSCSFRFPRPLSASVFLCDCFPPVTANILTARSKNSAATDDSHEYCLKYVAGPLVPTITGTSVFTATVGGMPRRTQLSSGRLSCLVPVGGRGDLFFGGIVSWFDELG